VHTTALTNAEFEKYLEPISSNGARFSYVRKVELSQMHQGPRGPDKAPAVPLLGKLKNNDRYVIYRCTLFIDAFSSSSFTAANYHGVYLQPLTVPTRSRTDSASARPLTLVPPGVSMREVLDIILTDLMAFYTTGCSVVDSTGRERTLFVDIVNLVGDTPGMNAFTDMKGHTSTAFCHRCRFSRTYVKTVGNACLGKLDCAMRTASRRTGDRHRTVRASAPPAGVLDRLGIPENPSRTRLALYKWQDEIRATRGTVPVTSEDRPVVPSDFDPFQGTAIGFDHVFAGHFSDLLNAAFCCLPTTPSRKKFEKAMLSLMATKHQPQQARLYSYEKSRLLKMSTTQKYVLLPFVPLAYAVTINGLDGADVDAEPITSPHSEYRKLILEALVSLCSLVGCIWCIPRWSTSNLAPYDDVLKSTFRCHWRNLAMLCDVPEAMELACKDKDNVTLNKKKIPKEYKSRFMCIRYLEKPNTHRLHEYVIEQILDWSHPIWMGELSLERAHQKMKTALQKTNGKEEHLQVMNAVRFNDWLGRLTSVIHSNGGSVSLHVAECSRLLHGPKIASGPEDHALMGKLSTFFDPGGLIYKTILLDKATVFGKHGTFCNHPDHFHFLHSYDVQQMSPLDLFDFNADGSDVCAAVGLDHHPENNPTFLSKVTKHCRCKQRGIVLSAGDVRVKRTHINGDTATEYHRILFFVRQVTPNTGYTMVLEEWTRVGNSAECTTIVRRAAQPGYLLEALTTSTLIYPLLHNCIGSPCYSGDNNFIQHCPNAAGNMEYRLLDAFMAFPPRKG